MRSLILGLVFSLPPLFTWIAIQLKRRNRPPLPPGPPADPFIGHVRILPRRHNDIFSHELSKKYGKVASLSVAGRTMIIINSAKAAVDLLDKRAVIYSDRPPCPTIQLMGFEKNVGFMSYGKEFQKHLRLLNKYLNNDVCRSYQPHQAEEAKRLIANLAKKPELYVEHLSRFAAVVILRVMHGQEVKTDDDPYVQVMRDAAYCNANCAPPGSNLVDLFPVLQHFPCWFPGAYPAVLARSLRPMVDTLHNYPFESVKKQMEDCIALDSFISTHLEELEREGENCPYTEDDIKGAAATSYTAGTDTCLAQNELDRVVEAGCFPTFDDRERLPYLECVIQKIYRWHPAVPSGLPHCVTQDDVYDGMSIPKGSVVIPNTVGMSLDEDVYKDPFTFDPSRYIRGEPHPIAHFGFGRRVYMGRHFADASLWIAITSMLSMFTFTPAYDKNGDEILPREEFISGITSHPKPFKCTITFRHKSSLGQWM